tara:strand:+ start:426 stop:647 length:222 start_codon:yes stop_codon:yes gene_type:complete
MGEYNFNKKEYEARLWCNRNNIWMSPFAKDSRSWYIDVMINNEVKRSPVAYGKVEIWKKCFEFYMYYYNKFNK